MPPSLVVTSAAPSPHAPATATAQTTAAKPTHRQPERMVLLPPRPVRSRGHATGRARALEKTWEIFFPPVDIRRDGSGVARNIRGTASAGTSGSASDQPHAVAPAIHRSDGCRGLLPRDRRAGPAIRRPLLSRRPHHAHLLPPGMPRARSATRERRVVSLRRGRAVRRVPR